MHTNYNDSPQARLQHQGSVRCHQSGAHHDLCENCGRHAARTPHRRAHRHSRWEPSRAHCRGRL